MSHNKVKVGTATPDATGALSVALNDLSDVSATPSNNDYLVYSSGSWSATAPTTTTTAEYIWLGEGASQTYPEGWIANRHVYFYAASPVNQISSATLASSDSFTNWYDEISIPSGTYLAQCRVEGDFTSSSGVFRYQFTTEISGTTTTHAASGVTSDLGNTNQNPAQAQALINIASAATLRVNIISAGASNLATTGMTTNQGLYGYLWLMKVG
jgi:hypothetical protein